MNYRKIFTSNHFNQDAATECATIKRLVNEVSIEILIIKVCAKKNLKESFRQNPRAYIVKMCDMRVRNVRETIDEREEDSNIRYHRDIVMIEDIMISKSTNKLIREIDTIEEEKRYFVKKFPGKEDLINIRVRVNILGLRKTALVIKYYYGMNHYGEREIS